MIYKASHICYLGIKELCLLPAVNRYNEEPFLFSPIYVICHCPLCILVHSREGLVHYYDIRICPHHGSHYGDSPLLPT